MVISQLNCPITIYVDVARGINEVLEENQHLLFLLDLPDDYLQTEVDPRLGDLLTTNSHRGLS